jgi:hypothetical protein
LVPLSQMIGGIPVCGPLRGDGGGKSTGTKWARAGSGNAGRRLPTTRIT